VGGHGEGGDASRTEQRETRTYRNKAHSTGTSPALHPAHTDNASHASAGDTPSPPAGKEKAAPSPADKKSVSPNRQHHNVHKDSHPNRCDLRILSEPSSS
jgi:hypothetical protein